MGTSDVREFVDNAESGEAWNGVLFERFSRFRHLVTAGLSSHGDEALRRVPPPAGARVLDIGCGFGDMSLQIARLVGPRGSVTGLDISEGFVQAARRDAAEQGVANASFATADVQADPLGGPFDRAYSRFGTMFFASPVAALRNVRRALVPGGRLCMVVWRRKDDNDWLHRAELIVKDMVEEDEDTTAPRCGPGPFSMADADTTTAVLLAAGFRDPALLRYDHPIQVGRDIDEAVDFLMSLGPAGEAIRRAGPAADQLRPRIAEALRQDLAGFVGDDGVRAPASTWIVDAAA